MGQQLYEASRQLFTRDPDEMYPSLQTLQDFLVNRDSRALEQDVDYTDVAAEPTCDEDSPQDGQGLGLVLGTDYKVHLNDWSFRQLCGLSGAPSEFINRLTADLAAKVLNGTRELYGKEQAEGRLLLQVNGGTGCRAIYSRKYVRVPDSRVVATVQEWATDFVPAGQVAGRDQGGSLRDATGLYASDRDIFLFLVNESLPIEVSNPEVLFPGFMVWNSETRSKTLGYMTFLYRMVCANHIVWGAEEVCRGERRHIGETVEALDDLSHAIEALQQRAVGKDEVTATVKAAIDATFADDEEKVVERLRGKGMTKGMAEKTLKRAKMDPSFGGDFSVWNVVQGLTAAAQDSSHAEDRVKVEKFAGKLLASV